MKNVIFSFHAKIEDNQTRKESYFHDDTMNKSDRTHLQFTKYKQRLIDCKKKYAEQCDADFIFYDTIEKQFLNDQFDSINFYKHYLIKQLCQKYDNVLYLDFDVIPNTTQSFFTQHDMNKINVFAVNSTKQNVWTSDAKLSRHDYAKTMRIHFGRYHMYCKAVCKLAMLSVDNIYNNDYHIANTGIIGGSAEALQKVDVIDNLDLCMDKLQQAKKENMFGDELTEYFFPNNEVFFSYLLEKNNIAWNNLPPAWHTVIYRTRKQTINDTKLLIKNANMVHIIGKDFGIMLDD